MNSIIAKQDKIAEERAKDEKQRLEEELKKKQEEEAGTGQGAQE